MHDFIVNNFKGATITIVTSAGTVSGSVADGSVKGIIVLYTTGGPTYFVNVESIVYFY